MKKELTTAEKNNRMHLIGRIWMLVGMALIVTIPVWAGLYYGVTPDWGVFASSAVISPLILMALSGIAEPIVYAPVVGLNGMYLSFITGNLSNLKIPCVVKAQEIAGTKIGTEENELVATIAIATSSLVTILIIGIFVLCLAVIPNLTETVQNTPYLVPAFGSVVYALFGSLGGKYIVKNPKLAAFPLVIIVVLSIILGVVGSDPGSVYLFVGIAICLVFAILQFFREKKKLREKEEQQRLAAIAAGMSYEKVVEIEKAQLADEKGESPVAELPASEIAETCVAENIDEIIEMAETPEDKEE